MEHTKPTKSIATQRKRTLRDRIIWVSVTLAFTLVGGIAGFFVRQSEVDRLQGQIAFHNTNRVPINTTNPYVTPPDIDESKIKPNKDCSGVIESAEASAGKAQFKSVNVATGALATNGNGVEAYYYWRTVKPKVVDLNCNYLDIPLSSLKPGEYVTVYLTASTQDGGEIVAIQQLGY